MSVDPQFAQVTKRLRTSSAVVPALVLTAICTPCGLLAARFFEGALTFACFVLAMLPPFVAISQVIFFTFIDRDRLQNEDHVERKMMIAKGIGDARGVILNPVQGHLTSNPEADGGRIV